MTIIASKDGVPIDSLSDASKIVPWLMQQGFSFTDAEGNNVSPLQGDTEATPELGPPAPGTHRETVHIVWSENALYAQDIEIDVPDDFNGDPASLVNGNDSFDDEENEVAGWPEGYKTNWLDRVDWLNTKSVSDRDIQDAHVLGKAR